MLGLAILVAACGGISTPSSNQTLTFTGTIQPSTGAGLGPLHTFSTTKTGDLIVRISATSPDATAALGIGYGTPTGTACAFFLGTGNIGRAGQTVVQTAIQAGTYCVGVFDPGGVLVASPPLTAAQTYTLSVSFP